LGKDLAGAGLALARHGSALGRHEAWAADLDGDILRAGVHSLPVGDTLRVGGQESGRWGLVVDAPLVGGVFCVWYWGWSGCAS